MPSSRFDDAQTLTLGQLVVHDLLATVVRDDRDLVETIVVLELDTAGHVRDRSLALRDTGLEQLLDTRQTAGDVLTAHHPGGTYAWSAAYRAHRSTVRRRYRRPRRCRRACRWPSNGRSTWRTRRCRWCRSGPSGPSPCVIPASSSASMAGSPRSEPRSTTTLPSLSTASAASVRAYVLGLDVGIADQLAGLVALGIALGLGDDHLDAALACHSRPRGR